MNPSDPNEGDQRSAEPSSKPAPALHPFESERLASLREFAPLLLPEDAPLTSLARQAVGLFHAPIGLVSLIEADAQRVVAAIGLDVERVDRCDTICATTILQPDVLVVEDVPKDPAFQHLPGVVGAPFIRFYAGAPIFDRSGLPLGTVCAVDTRPHEVSSRAVHALQRLATLASALLEARLLFARCAGGEGRDAERSAIRSRLEEVLLTFVNPRASGG